MDDDDDDDNDDDHDHDDGDDDNDDDDNDNDNDNVDDSLFSFHTVNFPNDGELYRFSISCFRS